MDRYISYVTRYPRTLATALIIGYPIANVVYLHWSLSRTIQHGKESKRLTSALKKTISSIPEEAFSSDHVVVHDWAQRSIPASKVPDLSLDELIVLYLKHTMSQFSRLPQAYLLKTMADPEDRKTFEADYISTLDFKEGDLVHGIYRVIARSDGKVEFALKPLGVVKGSRLVVAIERKGDELVCSSETAMWKYAGEKGLMPLERRLMKWMHEIASWGLLRSGTKYLMGLKTENQVM
ncbi:hypothetical protein BKA61DRAFT_602364 [Leptodontidium sp. MPI-SDFR-AT-0119]|nr:hypothetical protein BKA61DRAFT_602364 [Leptodontidium sp. MPI-SDFR-AT-0119]